MEWKYIPKTLLAGIYFIVFLLSLNVAFGIAIITHRALGCKLSGILSRLWWMRCSAVVLLTWHMAFLAGVFLDLYSPKYWNFDTIIQQEATMSNILLADKTRYLRAAMLRLVPAAIGIFLRSWAKKSEIPDLSPSGIIWGSTFIMIQLFLAIHLWKQSPKLDGDVVASAISYILYTGYRACETMRKLLSPPLICTIEPNLEDGMMQFAASLHLDGSCSTSVTCGEGSRRYETCSAAPPCHRSFRLECNFTILRPGWWSQVYVLLLVGGIIFASVYITYRSAFSFWDENLMNSLTDKLDEKNPSEGASTVEKH